LHGGVGSQKSHAENGRGHDGAQGNFGGGHDEISPNSRVARYVTEKIFGSFAAPLPMVNIDNAPPINRSAFQCTIAPVLRCANAFSDTPPREHGGKFIQICGRSPGAVAVHISLLKGRSTGTMRSRTAVCLSRHRRMSHRFVPSRDAPEYFSKNPKLDRCQSHSSHEENHRIQHLRRASRRSPVRECA
jgi:hypothetical protein